jgi:spore coat protein U domain-containing protein, fimbrial subunit CupE1/2/3/6
MMRRALGLLALAVALAVAAPAQALLATCTVNSPSIAFGSYSVINATPLQSTATVTVMCTADLILGLLVNFNVSLSPGGSGNELARYMTFGSSHLKYNVYTNSTYTSIWGDGSNGTSELSGSFTAVIGGASQSITVYGQIPVAQPVPVGSYGDSLTITVSY